MRSEKPSKQVITPDLGNIWIEAEGLENRTQYEMNGATIIRGIHAELGQVDIVITDFGDARILCSTK